MTDLCMEIANCSESTEVEIFAEHKRANDCIQLLKMFAMNGARFNPRVTFPRTPLAHEVVLEHRVAHRKWA
jgi:hypothetical protein